MPYTLPSHILKNPFFLWLEILRPDADCDFQQRQVPASLLKEVFPYSPLNNCENPTWSLVTVPDVFSTASTATR